MTTTPAIRIGCLRIADHLVLGVTAEKQRTGDVRFLSFHMEVLPMDTWDELIQGLIQETLEGAFIPIPAAIHLFRSGTDLRLITFVDRGQSPVLINRISNIHQTEDFKGKTVLIPHFFSIQHMLLHYLFSSAGLKFGRTGENSIDVVSESFPSPVIAEMFENGLNSGIGGASLYEPFGTKALMSNSCDVLCQSTRLWKGHPCCAFVLKDSVCMDYPGVVKTLVNSFAHSGEMLSRNSPEDVFRYAKPFMACEDNLLKRILPEISGMFSPPDSSSVPKSLQVIQSYMIHKMGILDQAVNIEKFIYSQ